VKSFAPSIFSRRRIAASGGSTPGGDHALQFRQLVLPHLDGAYNLARYLTRDATLSEDVVQDALLRAYRAFEQFRGGSARAWLFAIVRNCCATALAGRRGSLALVVHESSLDEEAARQLNEHPDATATPEERAIQADEVERVRSAIEAIPEPFREAVVLRDLEDLAYAEIAEVTGVPLGTVMSRLARGRAMLAKQLLPAGRAESEPSRSVK
jgi:RNA polymerase sigma-70 factor, ECF subfamily